MLEGFWAVGTVIVAVTAWIASAYGVADAWRWIFAVTALPALIGVFLRWWVPESPMFLLKSGRADEAKTVLNQVLVTNGKPALGSDVSLQVPVSANTSGIFSAPLRRRSIAMLLVWFFVSISYYGIFTWMPARLAGEGFGFVRGYGFLVVVALAQIPGYALAAYGVEAWGRKPTLVGFLLLSAAACALFTVAGTGVMVGASILVMSFALLGTWGALYAFTPELYPTETRATGMGAASAMARFGGLLAPSLMTIVIAQSFVGAVGLFAFFLLLGAITAGMIDHETREKALS
jgi:putative MFS transporter